MSASNFSVLFAQTIQTRKIVFLPAASSVPGRVLYIKDICGNAAPSSIFISTSVGDMIDYNRRTWYATMSTSAASVKLASNGLNNWMVLSHYTDALGQPPYVPPAPPVPPFSGWSSVTDGADASVVNNGGGSYTCNGPNDGGGTGWAYIYALFSSAGSLTYSFSWFTSDGITWDWPFEFVTANNPSNPGNVNFNTKIASTNSQSGSRTVSYGANQYVVLGVYSVDSIAGRGTCTFSGLPT